MATRSISEIMAEGQKLTLEHSELLRKSIVGETLTAEEVARKAQLEGYLLGLMGQAQSMGVGTAVGTGYGQVTDEDLDEDESWGDEDLYADEDEVNGEQGQAGFGFGRY